MIKFSMVLLFFVKVLWTQEIGSPVGLMSDCPGMTHTTTLSEATKKSLAVVALKQTKGRFFSTSESRCSFDQKGALCVARQINLKKKKTQVLMSGYLDSSFSPLVRAVADGYLRRGRNVIIVETFPILVRAYPLAARITRPLGELLGEFLVMLTKLGLSTRRLELGGASLGAHIAHFAGVKFLQLTGEKIPRLTALDPAGPCFRHLDPSRRLNRSAAQRVDVLHTNIDGFGLADPLGHVDFYANGGEFQQINLFGMVMPCLSVCSHLKSALYWIFALKYPEKFIAVSCSSVRHVRMGDCRIDRNMTTNLLGPKTDFTKPGIYYLPTNELPPYHRGMEDYKQKTLRSNRYLQVPDEDLVL